MRTRPSDLPLFLLLIGLSLPSSLLGQHEAASSETPTSQATEVYQISGSEVPNYYLFQHFFSQAYAMFRHGDDEARRYFLTLLEIKPNRQTEKALDSALTKFESIFLGESREVRQRGNIVDIIGRPVEDLENLSEEEFSDRVDAAELENAKYLGVIYHDLQEDLKKAGASHNGIENYVSQRLRPKAHMTTTEPYGNNHSSRILDRVFAELAYGKGDES